MDIKHLEIDPLYQNKLNMQRFARMLDSPTQSYKFYWLEAVLTLLPNKDEMSFREVVFEMFWEAWYTVSQYHLHLGPTIEGKSENYIEHAVHVIEQDSEVRLPMHRDQFMSLLDKNWDLIKADVDGLIKNVPYRILSSFMGEIKGNDVIWDQKKRLIIYLESLNKTVYLPYVIIDGGGSQKKIRVSSAWKSVMLDNYVVIKSWIQMKKVRFLQNRNPGVPGIIYKLEDADNRVRKLGKARELWLAYETESGKEIRDLYSEERIESDRLSLDHFVPWSFVTNDELWNLVPMERNHNSSKGNRLPEWDRFFPRLSSTQYDLYTEIFANEYVRKKFEACKLDNLNALWASEYLYVPGNTQEQFRNILERNLKPIYETAMLQGYTIWK